MSETVRAVAVELPPTRISRPLRKRPLLVLILLLGPSCLALLGWVTMPLLLSDERSDRAACIAEFGVTDRIETIGWTGTERRLVGFRLHSGSERLEWHLLGGWHTFVRHDADPREFIEFAIRWDGGGCNREAVLHADRQPVLGE